MKKAIFVDRDGTLLREPADEQIDSLEKTVFVPGAIGGMARLAGLGFDLVLATNQDGLGTPAFPEADFLPPQQLLLATLATNGKSTIRNIGQIERGYERVDEKLRALGARISRI